MCIELSKFILRFQISPRYHKRICFVGITLTGHIFKLPLCQRMSIVEDKMTPFIERRPQIGKMFPRKINHQFWSLLKFAHLLQNTQEHYWSAHHALLFIINKPIKSKHENIFWFHFLENIRNKFLWLSKHFWCYFLLKIISGMAFKKILFWDKSTELWRKKFPKKRNCGVAQANVTGGCVEVAPVLEIKFTNKVGSEALLPSLILGRVGFGLVGEGIQPPCIRMGVDLEMFTSMRIREMQFTEIEE